MKKEDKRMDTMEETVVRLRRETVDEDTVKVPGFGFLDRQLWAGLEPLRRVSSACFQSFNVTFNLLQQ